MLFVPIARLLILSVPRLLAIVLLPLVPLLPLPLLLLPLLHVGGLLLSRHHAEVLGGNPTILLWLSARVWLLRMLTHPWRCRWGWRRCNIVCAPLICPQMFIWRRGRRSKACLQIHVLHLLLAMGWGVGWGSQSWLICRRWGRQGWLH